jgi:DHA1 family bicyclomycin/chloramphenicol resistance-like MFS transporter
LANAIAPFSIALYLPAVPAVAHHFAAPILEVQASISSYLVVFAVATFSAGALADHYGRRPILFGGVALSVVAAAMGVFAWHMALVIASRCLLAIAVAMLVGAARAIAADLYSGPHFTSILARFTVATMAVTAVTSAAAGWLVGSYGWQAPFVGPGGLALLIGALAIVAPHRASAPPRPSSASRMPMIADVIGLFRSRKFGLITLQMSLSYAIIQVFGATAPHVMRNGLKRPPEEFGLYNTAIFLAYFISSFYLAKRSGADRREHLIRLGTAMQWISMSVGALALLWALKDPRIVFALFAIVSLAQGLATPNLYAEAIEAAPGQAGLASSMVTFFPLIASASCVQFVAHASTLSWTPLLSFGFLFATLVAVTQWIRTFASRRQVVV